MAGQRRTLIRWLLGGGFSASVASFLYPAFRFIDPPEVPEAVVNEASVAKTSDLKPDSGKIVKFGSKPALLVRVGESEWKAYHAICTHLNCTVQFHDANRQIWCACHNGFYDLNGKVVSGPPPAPLEEYAVHVRGDDVVIARRT
jgi:Rieske Fe-S protein